MATAIFTSCLGIACPVGFTPADAAAAMRASVNTFAELPYLDGRGEVIVGAEVPGLPEQVSGRERLATLLCWALNSALRQLPAAIRIQDLPLLLCTRETTRDGASLQGLVPAVEDRLAMRFRREGSRHVDTGAVAVFDALREARAILRTGLAPACLIACVDSFIDARCLRWLESADRLKSARQPDGVIPGEAACVILVSLQPSTPTCLRVIGLGSGFEPANLTNDAPLLGDGMAEALRAALGEAGIAMHDVAFRLSDAAGESYAFEELALAQTRVMRRTRETQDLWHPASSVGDSGAAAGALQLAWAEQAYARLYAPGRIAVAQASAHAGARAAAVLMDT